MAANMMLGSVFAEGGVLHMYGLGEGPRGFFPILVEHPTPQTMLAGDGPIGVDKLHPDDLAQMKEQVKLLHNDGWMRQNAKDILTRAVAGEQNAAAIFTLCQRNALDMLDIIRNEEK